ncbi:unnamed protein product, partial [Meganyctiphanes norvegica]
MHDLLDTNRRQQHPHSFPDIPGRGTMVNSNQVWLALKDSHNEKYSEGSSEESINQVDASVNEGKSTGDIVKLCEDKRAEDLSSANLLKTEKLASTFEGPIVTEEPLKTDMSKDLLYDNKKLIGNVAINDSQSPEISKSIESEILNIGATPVKNEKAVSMKTKTEEKITHVLEEVKDKKIPCRSEVEKA